VFENKPLGDFGLNKSEDRLASLLSEELDAGKKKPLKIGPLESLNLREKIPVVMRHNTRKKFKIFPEW